ncbi:MAG: Na+/H+ antiporter NhaA [candidate division WOR-3 bacterium]
MKSYIEELLKLFQVSGYILILSFFVALIWSNLSDSYFRIFHNKSVHFFINEILMTLFFLLVGLEIKRELLIGHLNSFKKALLPAILAFFGAIVPAVIFLAFNISNSDTIRGWGIPMATDIAFAFLIISLSKAPYSLRIILLSVAIIDDIIAVIVIGLFYTKGFDLVFTLFILIIAIFLFLINKYFYRDWVLIFSFPVVWYLFYKAGIHPAISGVFLSFFVRLDKIEAWENKIDNFVDFVVLPIFILGNSGIEINHFDFSNIFSSLSLGIMIGLFFGKQIGITISAFIFKKLKIVEFPENINLSHIWAMSLTCAIGFTMSIFISELAFYSNRELLEMSKMSIFFASFASAILGLFVFRTLKF